VHNQLIQSAHFVEFAEYVPCSGIDHLNWLRGNMRLVISPDAFREWVGVYSTFKLTYHRNLKQLLDQKFERVDTIVSAVVARVDTEREKWNKILSSSDEIDQRWIEGDKPEEDQSVLDNAINAAHVTRLAPYIDTIQRKWSELPVIRLTNYVLCCRIEHLSSELTSLLFQLCTDSVKVEPELAQRLLTSIDDAMLRLIEQTLVPPSRIAPLQLAQWILQYACQGDSSPNDVSIATLVRSCACEIQNLHSYLEDCVAAMDLQSRLSEWAVFDMIPDVSAPATQSSVTRGNVSGAEAMLTPVEMTTVLDAIDADLVCSRRLSPRAQGLAAFGVANVSLSHHALYENKLLLLFERVSTSIPSDHTCETPMQFARVVAYIFLHYRQSWDDTTTQRIAQIMDSDNDHVSLEDVLRTLYEAGCACNDHQVLHLTERVLGPVLRFQPALSSCSKVLLQAFLRLFCNTLKLHLLAPTSPVDPAARPAFQAQLLRTRVSSLQRQLTAQSAISVALGSSNITSTVAAAVSQSTSLLGEAVKLDDSAIKRPKEAQPFRCLFEEISQFVHTLCAPERLLSLAERVISAHRKFGECQLAIPSRWVHLLWMWSNLLWSMMQ
jgi:hypothetical protein